MNENQENQHFKNDDRDTPKEPFTKKMARFSAFIYLGLAITVVIVATVGIFSISYDYDDELPSVSIPDINFNQSTSSAPESNIEVKPPVSEKPAGNEESNVDAELEKPDTSKDEPRTMFYRPVAGEIIKGHSEDTLVFSQTMGDYRVHMGIDIAADQGTEVVSFSDGVVAAIDEDYFYGMTVAITHDNGVISYYKNLDKALAENIIVGSEVLAGQAIGKVGSTARIEASDQSHLHFELVVNGEQVNPVPELPNS